MNYLNNIKKYIKSKFNKKDFIIIFILILFTNWIAQILIIPSGSMKNTLLVGDVVIGTKFNYGISFPKIPFSNISILPNYTKNDHLIDFNGPNRNEIVIFRYPNNPKILFVKRCFAKEGDEILFNKRDFYLKVNQHTKKFINNTFDENKELISNLVYINNEEWIKNPYSHIRKGINQEDSDLISKIKDNNKIKNIFDFMKIIYNEQHNQNIELLKSRKDNVSNKLIVDMDLIKINNKEYFYKKLNKDEYYMIGDNRENSNDSRFWGVVNYKHIIGRPLLVLFSINSGGLKKDRVFKFLLNE